MNMQKYKFLALGLSMFILLVVIISIVYIALKDDNKSISIIPAENSNTENLDFEDIYSLRAQIGDAFKIDALNAIWDTAELADYNCEINNSDLNEQLYSITCENNNATDKVLLTATIVIDPIYTGGGCGGYFTGIEVPGVIVGDENGVTVLGQMYQRHEAITSIAEGEIKDVVRNLFNKYGEDDIASYIYGYYLPKNGIPAGPCGNAFELGDHTIAMDYVVLGLSEGEKDVELQEYRELTYRLFEEFLTQN
jgi:hypothetical protein